MKGNLSMQTEYIIPNKNKMSLSMKLNNKKQLLDTFSEHLQKNFSAHCNTQGLEPNLDTFTTYMVDRGLINNTAIQRYAVLAIFDELHNREPMTKSQLVDILADRFHLSPRSIWNVLRGRSMNKTI